MTRILRAADRIAVPWKNGGGVTREVAVCPEGAGFDNFDWRISIAEVREAGPFSYFDGIDRTMMILSGRLSLNIDDQSVELDSNSAPFAFSGQAACVGSPVNGPVTDLNVMTRRGRCAARVERVGNASAQTAATAIVVAIGPATLATGGEAVSLGTHDAAQIGGAHDIQIAGNAWLIQIA